MAAKESFTMKKSYKLVPPDGGYGYVILIASAMLLIPITMFNVCFGMIFNDFFIHVGMGSTAINLLTGINAMSLAVSGFFSGPLLKTLSRRKLSFIGSVFLNLGMFGCVFVKSEAQLIFCQGLQNFGTGFLFNVGCTMVNDYFEEKRLFSMSIAQTFSAAAAMVAPMIVTWANSEYGFRGTLIVVSAFGLQTLVATALIQPVAWHMKKEPLDDVPEKKLLLQLDKSVDNSKVLQTPEINLTDIEKTDVEKSDMVYEEKESAKPSIGNVVITWIKNFLDWPLFKRFILTCGCLGPPTAMFADFTFLNFTAQALYEWKWDNDQVKWAMALTGVGDMAGRICFIFFSAWINRLGSHPVYVAGLLIAIVTKLGILWVQDYWLALAIFTAMGVSRCSMMVLYPLVISDTVEPEEFSSAMGITMVIIGVLSIVLGPAVGAVRDATGNYTTMFLILTGVLVAIAVVWVVELLRARRQAKKAIK